MPTDVTEETFERDVIQRSFERPVVVDFWADWCGPCHALAPVLEREVDASAGGVELAKVDTEASPELAQRFGIRGIPAVKAFRKGRVVAEFVGVQPPQRVRAFLEELTAPSPLEQLLAEDGVDPQVRTLLERGDLEGVLGLLLDRVSRAGGEERERIRELMLRLFAELGPEHPTTVAYRRRLATALY